MAPNGSHALIIEDDALAGLEVQRCLKAAGFKSFAFAAAERQAVEQARIRRPDLVTVDISLLDGDGRAAIRTLEAEFGRLRVIYITGSPGEAAARDGAAILEKPFSQRELMSAWIRLSGEAEAGSGSP